MGRLLEFSCLLYEMIVGQTPFVKAGIDQLSLLKRIVKAHYKFPDKLATLSSGSGSGLDDALYHWKDLVSCLLKNRSLEWLGNLRNGAYEILDHDWFSNIGFNESQDQRERAPWVPHVGDPLDKSRDSNRLRIPWSFRSKITDEYQAAFVGF